MNSFRHVIDNPKKTWSLINSKILNKKRPKNALPSEIIIDENKFTDKKLIANRLNQHFAQKGHILASKLPDPQVSILDSMKPRKNILSPHGDKLRCQTS